MLRKILLLSCLSGMPLPLFPAQAALPSLDQQLLNSYENQNASGIRSLLDKGANVNARDDFGQTTLYKAAEHGDSETVQLLLNRGANLNSAGNSEATPLDVAAQRGWLDIITTLLNAGADVHYRTSDGVTPVSYAVLGMKEEDVADKLAAVKLLVEHGADIQSGGYRGETPLMNAAQNDNDLPVLQYLLQKGAALETKDNAGDTALGYAANSLQEKSMRTLLDHGAKIDTQNNAGATPLMLAAATGYPITVQLLLARKANITLKDGKGHSALFYATQKTYLGPAMKARAIRILKAHGAR